MKKIKTFVFVATAVFAFLSCVGVSRADYMTSEQCTAQGGSCNWISNYCSDDQESVGLCQGGTFSQGACCRPKLTDTSGADPDPIGAGLGAGGVLPDPNAGLGGPMGGTVTPGTSGIPTTSAPTSGSTGSSGGAITNPIAYNSFSSLFQGIMNYFRAIAGTIAVLFIAVGGVMYMVSGANKAVTERAKKTIIFAIIGLVLVIAAPMFLSDIQMVLKGSSNTGTSALLTVTTNVLRVLLASVGIFGIIGLLNGALILFISSGDEKTIEMGRTAIKYSLIAIALATGSLVLLKAIAGIITG